MHRGQKSVQHIGGIGLRRACRSPASVAEHLIACLAPVLVHSYFIISRIVANVVKIHDCSEVPSVGSR